MSDPSDNPPGKRRLWLAGLAALVGSLIVTLAVRSAALDTLDIPPEFPPLAGPGPAIFFTTVAVLGAAGVVGIIRRYTDRPRSLFRRIAVVVLLVSFLPDLWLLSDGAAGAFPGATPAGVGTLMLMHVLAAAVIVWSFTAGEPVTPTP